MSRFASDHAKFPLEGSVPDSAGGPRYAQIVDRLLAIPDSTHQVLVTSVNANDGKSVTAVNLAYAFHARKIPVLLLEFAFDRPVFEDIFGPSPISTGVEDALLLNHPLESIVCERADGLNVALIKGAYRSEGLPSAGPSLDSLLLQARALYEWTVIDGPSIESAPDVAALAKAVGLMLVVARARKTLSKALLKGIARFEQTKTLVVLNDV